MRSNSWKCHANSRTTYANSKTILTEIYHLSHRLKNDSLIFFSRRSPCQCDGIMNSALIDELIIRIVDLECAFKANLWSGCKRCCTRWKGLHHPLPLILVSLSLSLSLSLSVSVSLCFSLSLSLSLPSLPSLEIRPGGGFPKVNWRGALEHNRDRNCDNTRAQFVYRLLWSIEGKFLSCCSV